MAKEHFKSQSRSRKANAKTKANVKDNAQGKTEKAKAKQKTTPPLRHPFFDGKFIRLKTDIHNPQASFIDCIDALDRIRDMVAVFDCIQLGVELDGGGLPPYVHNGQYWMLSCMQDTLCYISKRLQTINRHKQKHHNRQIKKLNNVIEKLSQ